MEKAKIILAISKSKKNKVVGKLCFKDGTQMPLQHHNLQDITLNGSEVDVERKHGQPMLVKTKGKIIYDAHSQPSDQHRSLTQMQSSIDKDWQDKHVSHIRNPAHAPYNFVPLNRKVVEDDTPPPANKYDAKRNTGWIDIDIETLTPLYIRGTLTEKEIKEGKQNKDKPDFYAPAGKICIPGSSLRGMIRTMVEMISFGKFHFFDDKRLYYRGIADMSNLRSEYQSHMSSYDSRARREMYKMNAGYLVRDNLKYKIIPAKMIKGKEFDRISKADTEKHSEIRTYELDKKTYRFFKLKESYVVISGDMQNKKNNWIINPPNEDASPILLKDSDVKDYYSDEKRDAVNLIKELERDCKLKLPCFYAKWITKKNEERISFGHTAMFRLAYEKKIGEHFPEELKHTKSTETKSSTFNAGQGSHKIDFTEAIFGNEKTFAGRVFFEDALLANPKSNPQMEEQTPQILSTPKPTSFQQYLVQNNDEVRQLNHYNSNAIIRGYKFYWHKKSGKKWVETEKHGTQYTTIKPVKEKTKFSGRIRFENLSNEELGALLFAIDLPEGCCHKLGMGKPLGLGSVKIKPEVYISNRDKRYRDFFAEYGENKIKPLDTDKMCNIKRDFEKYVLLKINESSDKSLWGTERLQELLVMLQVEAGKELEKIGDCAYMKIEPRNDFKNRWVLPQASHVASNVKTKDILTELRIKSRSDDEQEIVSDKDNNSEIDMGKIAYIKEIVITGLWDKFDINWQLNKKVSILVGINGSGKSTILELINDVLSGEYENPEKVRYPARKLTVVFDNNKKLSYQRTELGAERTVGTQSSLFKPEFISAFDAPLVLEGILGKDLLEDNKVQVEKQLASKLKISISRFFKEVDTLRLVKIDSTSYIDDLVRLVSDEVFSPTKKSIEFVGEIKFNKAWKERFLADNDVSISLQKKIKAMVSDETYKLDEEFSGFMESKIGTVDASRYRSKILKYVEFVQSGKPSYAIFRLEDGQVLLPDDLSTGEKQILIILFTALNLKFRSLVSRDLHYVLIIDEPENSLHLRWQRFLISYIQRLNKNLQIIIATHAPAIIKRGYMLNIVEINQIKSFTGD